MSKTPFLSALALWPKQDAWGGGGLLDGPSLIRLNHGPMQQQLGEGFSLPRAVRVRAVAPWAGRGEDDPIEYERLKRDGWQHKQKGRAGNYSYENQYKWLLDTANVLMRCQPSGAYGNTTNIVLRRELQAIGVRDGSWYLEDYVLADSSEEPLRRITGCSWADFDQSGNLLFALGGKLYRLPRHAIASLAVDATQDAQLVADLSDMTFATCQAPDWAKRW